MPHMVTFDGLKFNGVSRANPNDSPGPAPDRLGRNAPTNSVSDQVAQFRTETQDVEALEAPISQVRPTQFSTTAKAIVWPSYQPEADGRHIYSDTGDHYYWDIKGGVSPSREVDGVSDQVAQLRDGVVHRDMPTDTHPNDNLLGYRGAGSEVLTNADALVQQVQHGCFEMQANKDFNTSALESLGADTIIKPQTDDALIAVVIISAMQSEPGSETFI